MVINQFVVGMEFGGHHGHRLCDVLSEEVSFGFVVVVYDVSSAWDRGWFVDGFK